MTRSRSVSKRFVLGGLGLLTILPASLWMALRAPLINDITTDVERPPLYWVRPPQRPAYDAVTFRAPTERAYGDLKNLALPVPPEAAYRRVLALVRARGWTLAAQDDAGRRVQAIAVTPLLRFRDDVVIEVRGGARDGESAVAMRSKSRLGQGDLGANARRIRAFFADLQRD